MRRCLRVERRNDAHRQLQRAAAIDELEQRMQVEPHVAAKPLRRGTREPCVEQTLLPPGDAPLQIASWWDEFGSHDPFATAGSQFLPLDHRG